MSFEQAGMVPLHIYYAEGLPRCWIDKVRVRGQVEDACVGGAIEIVMYRYEEESPKNIR